MYSNRAYNAKVDALHFVDGLIIAFETGVLFTINVVMCISALGESI
jgi:hypothetical protein